MNCLFCKIITRELPAEVLFEDNDVIVILDINPMNYGHALVIPKEHSENFLETAPGLSEKLFEISKSMAKIIKMSIEADGINIVCNNGSAAGQTVFHTHIHIIPRMNNDEFQFHLNLKKYTHNQLSEYGQLIRKSL